MCDVNQFLLAKESDQQMLLHDLPFSQLVRTLIDSYPPLHTFIMMSSPTNSKLSNYLQTDHVEQMYKIHLLQPSIKSF